MLGAHSDVERRSYGSNAVERGLRQAPRGGAQRLRSSRRHRAPLKRRRDVTRRVSVGPCDRVAGIQHFQGISATLRPADLTPSRDRGRVIAVLLLALLGQAHLADSRGVLAGVRTLSREGVRPVLTRSESGCDENPTAVAVPPRQAAARGRVGRPTGAQGLGWVDEAGHADERSCQLGVLSGGGVEAADVAPEQSLTRRGASRHTREGEVGAGAICHAGSTTPASSWCNRRGRSRRWRRRWRPRATALWVARVRPWPYVDDGDIAVGRGPAEPVTARSVGQPDLDFDPRPGRPIRACRATPVP